MRMLRLAALAWLVCAVAVGADAGEEPYWLAPMRKVAAEVSGYALRNRLNFQMFRQLHFRALGGQ